MAGALTPRDPINTSNHPDDPSVTASGGLTPTRFNNGVKLTQGLDKQLMERSTAADGTTGFNLTSTPTMSNVIFVSGTPSGTPAAGTIWMWADDVADVVTLYVKRSNGDIRTLVFP